MIVILYGNANGSLVPGSKVPGSGLEEFDDENRKI